MVATVTAVLTAGGAGLAMASDGPEPVETGYMVVEGASGTDTGAKDCPAEQAVLTSEGARL